MLTAGVSSVRLPSSYSPMGTSCSSPSTASSSLTILFLPGCKGNNPCNYKGKPSTVTAPDKLPCTVFCSGQNKCSTGKIRCDGKGGSECVCATKGSSSCDSDDANITEFAYA